MTVPYRPLTLEFGLIKALAVLPVNEEADKLIDGLISERIPKDQTSTLLEPTVEYTKAELAEFMATLPEPFPTLFKTTPVWLPVLMYDDSMENKPERLTVTWAKVADVLKDHAFGLVMRTGHNDVNSIVEEIKTLLEAEAKKSLDKDVRCFNV